MEEHNDISKQHTLRLGELEDTYTTAELQKLNKNLPSTSELC